MSPTRPLRFAPAWLVLATLVLSAGGCGSKPSQTASDESPDATPVPAPIPAAGTTPAEPREKPAIGSAAAAEVPVSLELGEKVFKQRCVLCHGPDGHGNGTAAAALNPHPRNFHDAAYMKSRTDDQLLLTIHNGKGPMPAWKSVLSETEMKSVLLFVRQFANTP